MRRRMLRDLPPHGPWDVKLRPGGLVEIEFIAQTLQLVHAHEPWFRRNPTTRTALAHLARHRIIPLAHARTLVTTDRVWRTIQSILRLTVGRVQSEVLPELTASHLLDAAAAAGMKAGTIPDLLHRMDEAAHQIRSLFERYLAPLSDP
jgi:glutamate-ammonia-ligase adenylyltransferase